MVKNLLAMWDTQVQSLGQEDHLEIGMAIHSSIRAREPHGQRNLAGRKELDTTEQLLLLLSWLNKFRLYPNIQPCKISLNLLACLQGGLGNCLPFMAVDLNHPYKISVP